jgi:hypothetical protein
MAELAAVASIAGLASLALQLGEIGLKVKRLCRKFRDVPDTLEGFVLEITALELHIQHLQTRFLSKAPDVMVIGQFNAAIQLCQRSIGKVSCVLEYFESRLKKSEKLGKLAFMTRENEINQMFQEIEREKSSLILATQILTESGQPHLFCNQQTNQFTQSLPTS